MIGLNLSPMVKNLLIINVGVFLIASLINFSGVYDFMALKYYGASDFKIYQIITHMFMHGGFMHILFNMFGLVIFGTALENVWGHKRFILFYLVCGVGSALLHTGIQAIEFHQIQEAISAYQTNPNPHSYELLMFKHFKNFSNFPQFQEFFFQFTKSFRDNPENTSYIKDSIRFLNQFYYLKMNSTSAVGASGAIFGLLLGFGMLFPNTELMMLFFPIPIKAKYFVVLYGLLELYLGIKASEGDLIAHFAHLGGMLFGFIMIKYWQRQRNTFY